MMPLEVHAIFDDSVAAPIHHISAIAMTYCRIIFTISYARLYSGDGVAAC